jgi:ferrochelatase
VSAAGAPAGVLLVNLGTPDAPEPAALRRYLREFLSDPLVVDLPRWLWWPLLNGLVLPLRAPRSAELYRRVWSAQGSPLLVNARRQADGLARALGAGFAVELGLRYGRPGLVEAVARLAARGARPVCLLPLFPQYSRTTVGSVERRVREIVRASGAPLELLQVPPFPAHRAYLASVAARIRAAAERLPAAHLVLSFHGLPQRYAEQPGEPYLEHCRATYRGLCALLDLAEEQVTLVFQSRFGRGEWLRPYADELVPALAARHPRLLVACPGFTGDCLETLDEIGVLLAERFQRAGGERLELVPGLNDGPDWIDALATLVREALAARAPFPAGTEGTEGA